MKRLSFNPVLGWTLVLFVFSISYSLLSFFKPSAATLPAYLVYIMMGVLGWFVYIDLQSLRDRVSQLENRIHSPDNPTNN